MNLKMTYDLLLTQALHYYFSCKERPPPVTTWTTWWTKLHEKRKKILGKNPLIFLLDRHHVWRSLDPTLAIWSNFMKERSIYSSFSFASFIRKDATFLYKNASFLLHLVIHPVIHQVIRPDIHLVINSVIRLVICPVILGYLSPVIWFH